MRGLFERPTIGRVLLVVAAWVALITALHVTINRRSSLAPASEARTLQVGGLPVT